MDTITKEEINSLTPVEKIQTLIAIIDTPIGRKKFPKDIVLLAQSLKDDFPYKHPHQSITINN